MRSVSYYVHARRWLSELEFFQLEVSFLGRLLADYFIRLTADRQCCQKLKGSEENLVKLEKEISELAMQLQEHIHLIDRESRRPAGGGEALAARQVAMDIRIAKLTGRYRHTKCKLFDVVAAIVSKNKLLAG